MFKQVSVLMISIALLLGFSHTTIATEESAQTGTIVVYRSAEGSKTKKLKFAINLDEANLGRLKANRSLVATVEAGEYELNTSMKNGESILVNVIPGQTVYVHTRVTSLGHEITPELVLVEEQVAVADHPALESTI
jgi:hypothetical protein